MIEYSDLQDVINFLEYGTKLHISIVFLRDYGNIKTKLNSESTIHFSPACNEAKTQIGGFKRCFRCRNVAIRKAVNQKKPFGGVCINCIYEYCHPVIMDNVVVCIIFIGNIDSPKFIQRFKNPDAFHDTLEKDFDYSKCEKIARILESYTLTLLKNYTNNTDTVYNPLIENIKSYTEDTLAYDINISQLASSMHYNEKYLGRIFKKETGKSFKEYVNIRRARYAAQMLLESNDSITDIASKSGFNSVSYFNRVFKRIYSLSPTEYRRSNV